MWKFLLKRHKSGNRFERTRTVRERKPLLPGFIRLVMVNGADSLAREWALHYGYLIDGLMVITAYGQFNPVKHFQSIAHRQARQRKM